MAQPSRKRSNVEPPVARSRRRRAWLSAIIASLLTLVCIAMLEAAHRWRGFGGEVPLFEKVEAEPLSYDLRTDVLYAANFFRDVFRGRALPAGSMVEEAFASPKPMRAFRVFFVGESTVVGFPYPRHLAAPAFLQRILQDALPDRRVEVLNMGITAVASYPVYRTMEQVLRYEPDLIVWYGGHNEFFGAYGVAGTQGSPWLADLTYRVRQTGLFNAMQAWRVDEAAPDESLMELVAAGTGIAPDSPLRGRAIRSIETSLQRAAERCAAAGTPLVVCTLVANERDLAPLGEADAAHDPSDMEQPPSPATLDALAALVAQHPDDALLTYRLARAVDALEGVTAAAEIYRRARDLDGMPWRAPEAVNTMLRERVPEWGAVLADAESEMRRHAPGGVLGWALICDHLHPTPFGNAVLALSVARAALAERPEALARLRSVEDYAQESGATALVSHGVHRQLVEMFGSGPLARNNQAARDYHENVVTGLAMGLGIMEQRALEDAEHYRDASPGHHWPSFLAGRAYLRNAQYDEAALHLNAARLAALPRSVYSLEAHFFWFKAMAILQGDLDKAQRDLLTDLLLTSGRTITKPAPLEEDPEFVQAWEGRTRRAIGGLLLLAHRYDESQAYLESAMDYLPEDEQAEAQLDLMFLEHLRSQAAAGPSEPPSSH